MSSVRRACSHIREKWRQTALIFVLFVLFMGLGLGCLYYESRVEEEKKKLAQKTGAALVVGRERERHKTDREDMITLGQIEQLSDTEEVERIEVLGKARVSGEDVRAYWGFFEENDMERYDWRKELATELKREYLHIIGADNPAGNIRFREKKEVLLEGRFPKEGETRYAIITKKMAEENKKNLGDRITIKGDHGSKATLTIIGIQSQNFEEQLPMWADPCNRIYTDVNTMETITGEKAYNEVRFILKNAQDMEAFKAKAKEVFDAEKYLLMEDIAAYERGAQGIDSSGQTAGIAKWIILAADIVIFLLLTFWQMESRFREMGILLAMGEKKSGILFQIFLEMLMPMMAALVIVVGVGIGLMSVSGGGLLFISNILAVLIATIIPGMYILTKHPSELLVKEGRK